MEPSELEYEASVISQCASNIRSEKGYFSSGISAVNLDIRDDENAVLLQVFDIVKSEVDNLTSLMNQIAEELRQEACQLRKAEEEEKEKEKQSEQAGA